jgi:hypothetical protein
MQNNTRKEQSKEILKKNFSRNNLHHNMKEL